MQQDNNIDLPPLQNDSDATPAGLEQGITGDSNAQIPPTISQMIAGLPEEANDIDLIEKEWIVKAKQIVAHTINDPYHQQAAISQMKAEYMRKRYNKAVKGAEGV